MRIKMKMKRTRTLLARKRAIEGLTMRKKTAFMAVVCVASVVVLGIKLLNPTPVQIFVENETTIVNQVPGLFTYADMLTMTVAASLLSVSGMYLLFFDAVPQSSVGSSLLEERKQHWEAVAKTLKDDEQTIYQAIIDEGIIAQSQIVEKTGLPKSNVSRVLYVLESKGLIERRRQGMGNVVLLK
jgi:DNA-binding transcriptional ArsR family regulator